jgi:hypothetical protein
MTANAVVLRRLVDKLVFLQFIPRHNMAGETKLGMFGDQQAFVVGAVRFVTHCAFPDRCRPMQELKTPGSLVTLLTKGGNRLLSEQEFIVAAV